MRRGVCKLCLNDAELRWSHYLGKALYRLSSPEGEKPYFASPSLIIQDQKQIADHLLCGRCEQRFGKLGEDYVFALVNRNNGFKMMELVRANYNRWTSGDYTIYSAADMGIDTDALAYFALSVIWRGVHIWRTYNGRATGGLQLGSHRERLRRYLHGADPYPRGVVVKVSAALDEASQNFCKFPCPNAEQTDATVFTFVARGLWFDVAVGDDLPEYIYGNCCVSSPQKPIFVGDFERFVTYDCMRFRQTATIAKKILDREQAL